MMIDVDFFLGYKIFNMKCNWIQFLIYTYSTAFGV